MYQVIEKPKSESKNGFYWYSYCMNNPLKYTDPSGMRMAALDDYWNLGKEPTDYVSFGGRRASDGGGANGKNRPAFAFGSTNPDYQILFFSSHIFCI